MTVRDGLLTQLVEQGVDEAVAKTLLDYAALMGENVRLRTALERIAQEPAPGVTLSARNIARTALTGSRHDPHGVHNGPESTVS